MRPAQRFPRASSAVADSWTARLRVVHPFPSVLNGAVVAVVALVAGADPALATRLGASMTLLQFSIGAGNDIVDATRDSGRLDKAIPSGLMSIRLARLIAAACAGAGLLLALLVSPLVLAVGLGGLGIGAVYDLRAKGTPFSWVPFAVGIPILPVYGWLGATGGLHPVFLALVPAAATAGAALAVANAVVDVEQDTDAGASSIAVVLGTVRASLVAAVLQLIVAVLALATGLALGTPTGWQIAVAVSALVPVGGAVYGALTAHRPGSADRALAWEIQAVGMGLLAVAWISGLGASLGGLGG